MDIKLFSVLHILVAFQSLITVVYLIFQKTLKSSNYFLAGSLSLLFIHFAYNFLIANDIYINFLMNLSCVYGFAYGPFFYLYIKSLLYKDFRFKKLQWLHFSPFLIAVLFSNMGFSFCKNFAFGIFISLFSYSSVTIWIWIKYLRILRKTTAQPDPYLNNWVKVFNFLLLLIIFSDISSFLFNGFTIGEYYFQIEHFTQSLLLIFVLMIQYQSFFMSELFKKVAETDTKLFIENSPESKNNEEINFGAFDLQEINEFLLKAKIYLKPQLTIQALADEMKWSARKLSRIVNLHSGTNFSDYINKMRIEEACTRLKNPNDPNETISEVMYDCGFNSRSVFNALFKSHTGFTPSNYKKKHSL